MTLADLIALFAPQMMGNIAPGPEAPPYGVANMRNQSDPFGLARAGGFNYYPAQTFRGGGYGDFTLGTDSPNFLPYKPSSRPLPGTPTWRG